ncbi:hypothetical protein GFS31_09270 [Leptolyngbya sp. BL0902]|uniref:hormogonium polysaccharide biosynthesis protein HpsA n=1 Tax=Leptolyngbya sp. BL0902 TaxID=1115757 RepID=UPI0018E8B995|nr:hormogonium polysaccharide biosynthesis protein HpsA [Leptolyngbya sp. BL0902]QQE64247.1 hypothetical protein GFS31_09270 [Leptolyngbya sp. BL0902]
MHLHLLRKIWQFPRTVLKRFIQDLLRLTLLSTRPRRMAQAGFVLPTTVLLVLMVVLTATALTYRTFTRSEQAIVQREQQVIANAATPAIDRAKAKIEFLFRNDPRFPGDLPSSDFLYDMMSTRLGNQEISGFTGQVEPLTGGVGTGTGANRPVDPYTLADETRVDINNDGLLDNAWSFQSQGRTIVYSILVDDEVVATERNAPAATETRLARPYATANLNVMMPVNRAKANALITRTGPLAAAEAIPNCPNARAQAGWQPVAQGNSSTLQKNFQVTAFVANANGGPGQTFETLEFQQSRQASTASKWGAWFRYDLDLFPGADFNWNGAMHTDSSLFVNRNLVHLHMVSSHNSCVYSQEASEITVGQDDTTGFQGQVVKGNAVNDTYPAGDNPTIHVFTSLGNPPRTGDTLTNANHSVQNGRPSDISANPMALYTRDRMEHMRRDSWQRRAGWDTDANIFGVLGGGRTVNALVARPFVDDFFRADNRWGPKPRYDARTPAFDVSNTAGRRIGDAITEPGTNSLTDPSIGLDGFWERQAMRTGLRLVVGQRLELGNNQEWNRPPAGVPNEGDPLYPATARPVANARFGGNHEYMQRRSLMDNLAAVQGMVVYHYQKNGAAAATADAPGAFPVACVAATAHPGTRQSILNSRTFSRFQRADGTPTTLTRLDFFNGVGTNGWEVAWPTSFDTEGKFATEIAPNRPLGIALRNLANFAGDPSGGAPSFSAFQDDFVHPFPYQSMWGDFSPLRRILLNIDSAGTYSTARYDGLSPADKTTLHTAACTISLLAYNLGSAYAILDSELGTPLPSNLNFQNISTQLRNGMRSMLGFIETGADQGGKMLALFRRLANEGSYKPGRPIPGVTPTTYPPGTRWDGVFPAAGPLQTPAVSLVNTWIDPNPGTVLNPPLNLDGTPATRPNGQPIPSVCPPGTDGPGFQPDCDAAEFFAQFTRQDWLIMLDELTPATPQQIDLILSYGTRIDAVRDTMRDRALGFREGLTPERYRLDRQDLTTGNNVRWDKDSGMTQEYIPISNLEYPFQLGCSPNLFSETIAKGTGGKDDQVALTLVACSPNPDQEREAVRFPSLFYLFPLENHGLVGTGPIEQPGGTRTHPGDPRWIDRMTAYNDNYIAATTNGGRGLPSLMGANTFRVVGTGDRGFTAISAVPRLESNLPNWQLPVATTTGALTVDNLDDQASAFKINTGTLVLQVPFLEKGIFNGREQINTRVLDIDLDALTTQPVRGTVTGTADFWLSADRDGRQAEGAVYAFREDSVREDEIVRPRQPGATDCTGITAVVPRRLRIETEANCRMRVTNPSEPVLANNQDPPLTPQGISLKPIDFAPDPERRPYGFRLRTASGNPADFSGPNFARRVGMTFVTDDAVYIQGNFNPHSTTGGQNAAGVPNGLVEEFTQTLLDQDAANFRTRFYNGRTTLNIASFANLAVDRWRPVEILSDSVSILSRTFRDGEVEDAFLNAEPTAEGGANSSYMNQNRPRFAANLAADALIRYQRNEAPGTLTNEVRANSRPLYIDRSGTYYLPGADAGDPPRPFFDVYNNNNATSGWMEFTTADGTRRRNTQAAANTFVNAVFVSGITPKRPNQSYGGLHNYPRFIENWNGRSLSILGSFIQLNFSTAATAPFDQDVWEPGVDPVANEVIGYYNAPQRRWGYDVGLLYVPPAPAARRFVTIGAPRSEYYRELPSDDPYVQNLRCARAGNAFVLPEAMRATANCPA